MNDKIDSLEKIRQPAPKVGRGPDGRFMPGNPWGFQPGCSGNPSGKRKQTPEEREAVEKIRQPAPEVMRGPDGRFLPGNSCGFQPGHSWRFQPGHSGNPSGRRKQTPEEKEALEKIRQLAPGVADRMMELLDDELTPSNVKVRILEIILERTYGKPEAAIKLTNVQQNVEAAQERIAAIVENIRKRKE